MSEQERCGYRTLTATNEAACVLERGHRGPHRCEFEHGSGRGRLEDVLVAHAATSDLSSGADCACGWFQTVPRDFRGSPKFAAEHATHVAEQIRAHYEDEPTDDRPDFANYEQTLHSANERARLR